MPKYRVEVKQTVIESAVLYVQAHNPEQAEEIAQYIAENGKDPWDRHAINVSFFSDDIQDGPEATFCEETEADVSNIMPEHTEGLWAPAKEKT